MLSLIFFKCSSLDHTHKASWQNALHLPLLAIKFYSHLKVVHKMWGIPNNCLSVFVIPPTMLLSLSWHGAQRCCILLHDILIHWQALCERMFPLIIFVCSDILVYLFKFFKYYVHMWRHFKNAGAFSKSPHCCNKGVLVFNDHCEIILLLLLCTESMCKIHCKKQFHFTRVVKYCV